MKREVESHLVVTTKTENAAHIRGPGINYVCAECGMLLYHSEIDGAYEAGAVSFPAKKPAEVAGRLHECPRCGHKLNSSPDSDSIQISKEKNSKPADSRGPSIILNRTSSINTKVQERT